MGEVSAKMRSLFCLLLSVYTAAAFPQLAKEACPEVTLKKDFDVTQYLGKWYQQAAIPAFFSPAGSSCVRASYGLLDDGYVSVHNSQTTRRTHEYDEICGYAYQVDPVNEPADLRVNFPASPPGIYWVLDTDYENFTAIYSCEVVGIKFEYGWVMTRDPNPSQELIDQVFKVFTDQGISIDRFQPTNHTSSCAYDIPDGTTCIGDWGVPSTP